MGFAVHVILLALVVLGGWMFMRGRRGRAVDDHPVCAWCAFDLTGLPLAGGTCPECGARLSSPDAVRIGNRQRRHGLLYGGLVIALLAAVPPATSLVLTIANIDPIRIEPMWMLLRDATANPYKQRQACGEILYRVQRGHLSTANEQRVVATALHLQADLSWPWDPRWGDMVEAIQAGSRLPAADWQTYLSHDEPVMLFEVRPKCAAGDPIPFHAHGELRGASVPGKLPGGMPTLTMAVPGAVTQYPTWGGAFGETFDISGNALVTPASAALLRPGTQSMAVTFSGLANAIAAAPSQFAPVTCQGNWTLLPNGETSVQLYRDETIAAAVMNTLSFDLRTDSGITITVRADRPPVDLALDVVLRSGVHEWGSKGYWAILERNQPHGMGMAMFGGEASQVIGQRTDIVLRPSVHAAARTVHINRLLDHEFVFKDVLIANTR